MCFKSCTAIYAYVGGNPLSYIDPRGLSAADVKKIIITATDIMNNMTQNGERVSPGALNNMQQMCFMLGICSDKKERRACQEQANAEKEGLDSAYPGSRGFDDKWSFSVVFNMDYGLMPHYTVTARSSDSNDPDLIIDAWNSNFYPVQHGAGDAGNNVPAYQPWKLRQ